MPFGFGAKPKRKRRRSKGLPTPTNLKEALEQVLVRKALSDEEWGYRVAKQMNSIIIPEEDDDEIARTEKEITRAENELIVEALKTDPQYREQVKLRRLDAISHNNNGTGGTFDDEIKSAALEHIRTDPQLMAQLVQKEIAGMLGKRAPGDTMGDMFEHLRTLRELEEEFGGGEKKGMLAGILTPEVVITLLKTFGPAFGMQVPQVFTLPDGRQVGAEEYKQHLEATRRPQLQDGIRRIEKPPEAKAPESPPIQGEPVQAAPVAPIPTVAVQATPAETKPGGSLRLSEWLPYLENEPIDFVTTLLGKLTEGTEEEKKYAGFIIATMKEKDADELLALLQKFKDNSPTGKAIVALEEHKDWLVEVIDLVRGS